MAWKLLDHTADVVIEAEGDSWEEVFKDIATGMFEAMVDVSKVREARCFEVEVEGEDIGELLFNFLNELLVLKDAYGHVFSGFYITIQGGRKLKGKVCGDKVKPEYEPHGDVKAVSLHNFVVEERDGKKFARVVVDL